MNLETLLETFIIDYGLISIFILVALEYANVPLPSELVLPLIGIVGFNYNISFFIVVIVSTLGGIFGSLINYYLGKYFGENLLNIIREKLPKTKKSLEASYSWVKRYDQLSVMLSRCIPLARTVISLVAGVIKMDVGVFIGYSAIGILTWNALLISGGYFLGNNIELFKLIIDRFSIVSLVAIVVIILYFNKKRKY